MAMPVNVTSALGDKKVPVGRADIASYRISIEGPDPRMQDFPAESVELVASFTDVADGAYTARAQSLDAAGAVLDELSQTFDVVTPPTDKTVKAPVTINVTVGG